MLAPLAQTHRVQAGDLKAVSITGYSNFAAVSLQVSHSLCIYDCACGRLGVDVVT